jgi:hypothetical protein
MLLLCSHFLDILFLGYYILDFILLDFILFGYLILGSVLFGIAIIIALIVLMIITRYMNRLTNSSGIGNIHSLGRLRSLSIVWAP